MSFYSERANRIRQIACNNGILIMLEDFEKIAKNDNSWLVHKISQF